MIQQIAYQYAKRGANLVLVARRENRLRGISDNARRLGAPRVLIMAADVVKEDDCRRFITETIQYYGSSKPEELCSKSSIFLILSCFSFSFSFSVSVVN